MLKNNQPEMLKKVLEDEFYTFPYGFIFDEIGKILYVKEKGLHVDETEIGYVKLLFILFLEFFLRMLLNTIFIISP